MPNYGRSAYYLDTEAIRESVSAEVQIRGVSFTEMEEQTGVLAVGIGRFLNPRTSSALATDGLITLIKWAGLDVNRFVKRRRTIARHTDSYEQRQLRKGQAFVQSLGVAPEQSESSVDVLMRLLAEAKEKGFLA